MDHANDLWQLAADRARAAHRRGALVPLETATEIILDGGIPFVVHVLGALRAKLEATAAQARSGVNPFLPFDSDLLVAEVSPTHVCLLNKFNVLARHLLVVTRAFEPQDDLPSADDMDALVACMERGDGLGFSNGGAVAGASQPHRHLQLVALPLGPGPAPTPVDAALAEAPAVGAWRCPALPFAHAARRLGGRSLRREDAPALHAAVLELLAAVGVDGPGKPYNLLLTARWMMAVPRTAEGVAGISVNSLGFAGSLLVRDRATLDTLAAIGPLELLRRVSGPGS